MKSSGRFSLVINGQFVAQFSGLAYYTREPVELIDWPINGPSKSEVRAGEVRLLRSTSAQRQIAILTRTPALAPLLMLAHEDKRGTDLHS
jgi:hypothetical protein